MDALDSQSFTHPLAFCPRHGFFPATAIALGNVSRLTILDCKTNCSTCGRICEILPGEMNSVQGRLELLLDKSVSTEALSALREIAERLQDKKISEKQAKEEADKIFPGAAELFDFASWSDQAKATLIASVVGALALVASARMAGPSAPSVSVRPVIEQTVINKNSIRISNELRLPPELERALVEFIRKQDSRNVFSKASRREGAK